MVRRGIARLMHVIAGAMLWESIVHQNSYSLVYWWVSLLIFIIGGWLLGPATNEA